MTRLAGRRRVPTWIGLACALSGCATGSSTTTAFPSTWPGSTPLSERAPTVSVEPLQMAAEAQPPAAAESGEVGAEGLPTAAVLSVLLMKHLQVAGVNAVLEKPEASTAEYGLSCSVPKLSYGDASNFPKQRTYVAELVCTLKDEQTQAELWKRTLTQKYEETVVWNMMTKLPDQPHRQDRVLFRECIIPLWDAMASSVATVLTSHEQRADSARPGA
jgi:hypothetical protein